METSLIIAKVLGPLYMVAAIGWLFNRDFYRKMIAQFSQSHTTLYVSGILAFLFGAIILLLHPYWGTDWRVIITLLGGIGLLKGLSILLFPRTLITWSLAFVNRPALVAAAFALAFVLGVVLTWFAYFA